VSSLELATIGFALGWVAFGLYIAAFVVYNIKTQRGESRPNPATWSIWSIVAALNVGSYFMISQDWVTALQPFAGSLACTATFFLALAKGKFSKLGKVEFVVLAIALVAIAVWGVYRDATVTNLVLQGALMISILPAVKDVWRKPHKESPLPWFMWAGALILTLTTVALRWQGNLADLAYPINSLFWHALVGLLALRKGTSE
jgi:hypothetical protein